MNVEIPDPVWPDILKEFAHARTGSSSTAANVRHLNKKPKDKDFQAPIKKPQQTLEQFIQKMNNIMFLN